MVLRARRRARPRGSARCRAASGARDLVAGEQVALRLLEAHPVDPHRGRRRAPHARRRVAERRALAGHDRCRRTAPCRCRRRCTSPAPRRSSASTRTRASCRCRRSGRHHAVGRRPSPSARVGRSLARLRRASTSRARSRRRTPGPRRAAGSRARSRSASASSIGGGELVAQLGRDRVVLVGAGVRTIERTPASVSVRTDGTPGSAVGVAGVARVLPPVLGRRLPVVVDVDAVDRAGGEALAGTRCTAPGR